MPPSQPEEAFARFPQMLAGIGIQATEKQLGQFRIHFELLLRWNQKINLTAIRDPEEILERHFLESAFLTRVIQIGPGTLVDVGSGAGFPGIPVKVLCPGTRVILVEANQKKAAFLKEVTRAGGFQGLEVIAKRLGELDLSADWVTMRAVKPPFVPRGTLALFLGASDASKLTDWKIMPIPGSRERVIAVGPPSLL